MKQFKYIFFCRMQLCIKDKMEQMTCYRILWMQFGHTNILRVSINLETLSENSVVPSNFKTAHWEAFAFPSTVLLHKWNTELTRQKKWEKESELPEYKFDEKKKVTTEHRLISNTIVEYEIQHQQPAQDSKRNPLTPIHSAFRQSSNLPAWLLILFDSIRFGSC